MIRTLFTSIASLLRCKNGRGRKETVLFPEHSAPINQYNNQGLTLLRAVLLNPLTPNDGIDFLLNDQLHIAPRPCDPDSHQVHQVCLL